eukprot:3165652-Rhodomonas_salina.1
MGCTGCAEHKLSLASRVECTICWIRLRKRRQQGAAQQTRLAFDESLLQGFQRIRIAGCAFCGRLAGVQAEIAIAEIHSRGLHSFEFAIAYSVTVVP